MEQNNQLTEFDLSLFKKHTCNDLEKFKSKAKIGLGFRQRGFYTRYHGDTSVVTDGLNFLLIVDQDMMNIFIIPFEKCPFCYISAGGN